MPTTLEQIQYGFDRDSRRTWQKRPLSTTQDQAYQYDALSQVSAAARGSLNLNATAISGVPAAAENWDYDPTGNWRGYNQSANGAITLDQHRVHDRGNRLTQIEDNPHNMILDRAGRMRQLAPDAEGDWEGKLDIIWDAWSRITQVKNNGSVAGEYTYDGLFRRVTREVGSEILHSYYNDQWRPVEERKDAETTASMSYLWGARHRDDLVRRDRAVGGTMLNETRYILMDYFNPAAITDEEGTLTERYAFSAFGVRTILNPDFTVKTGGSECAMEFSFQGQFVDTESGLMNYGFRFYVPALGSWACKDPIEEAGGANLYAFSDNRSVNLVDQLGLVAMCCIDGKPVTLDFLKSTCCHDQMKWWNGNPYCHLPPGVKEEPPPPPRKGDGGGGGGGGSVDGYLGALAWVASKLGIEEDCRNRREHSNCALDVAFNLGVDWALGLSVYTIPIGAAKGLLDLDLNPFQQTIGYGFGATEATKQAGKHANAEFDRVGGEAVHQRNLDLVRSGRASNTIRSGLLGRSVLRGLAKGLPILGHVLSAYDAVNKLDECREKHC